MSLPYEKKVTLDEFYSMRDDHNQLFEFIDGIVFMSPSPSTMHQRISGRLHAWLFNFLEGKEYEVYYAPFDIELSDESKEEKIIVIPDLSVNCDKEGLDNNRYSGAPAIIIEIISSYLLKFESNKIVTIFVPSGG